MSEAKVKQLINQMLVEKIVFLTNDKYTLLKLGSLAKEVQQGNKKVIIKLSKDSLFEAESTNTTSSVKYKKAEILNSKGLELFDSLRELRSTIARGEGMPPYIIFSDKTLVDMCVKMPFERAEMLQVSGVGENKFEKYGQQFLEKILAFTGGIKDKYYFGTMGEASAMSTISDKKEPKTMTKTKLLKQEFHITKEMEDKITYTEKCLISYLVNQLNELRDSETMKKISGAELARWMTEEGYIAEVFEDGRRKKVVTQKGAEAGIVIGLRMSEKGTEYEDFYYEERAQRMLVKHLVHRNRGIDLAQL